MAKKLGAAINMYLIISILITSLTFQKYISLSYFSNLKAIWGEYYFGQISYTFSFASSCFLNLIVLHPSLLFPLFHWIHQRLYAIQTKALLYFNSETHFLLVNHFVIIILIQRRILGKWVQIVVGGVGKLPQIPIVTWKVN